jgi:hypothetical protein
VCLLLYITAGYGPGRTSRFGQEKDMESTFEGGSAWIPRRVS